jgi:DNA polymerase
MLPALDLSGKNWNEICSLICSCERCRLAKERTLSVPGIQGKINEITLIGEAPGRDEDLQGMPFVGASGKLLDKILTALKWKRGETVSILNTVKCRPPANRDPRPDEMGACACYLERQVELLDPKLVVLMGKSAIERVFGRQLKVSSLRGKVHTVRLGNKTRPVIVTYHPSYLLRSPREKRKAWADWCLIASELERLSKPDTQ